MAIVSTLTQAWNDANNVTFQGQCLVALELAGYAVLSESAGTQFHVSRVAAAVSFLNIITGDPYSVAKRLALGAVTNGLSAASSDAAIEALMTNGFNTIFNITS